MAQADRFLSMFMPLDTGENVKTYWANPRDSDGEDIEFDISNLRKYSTTTQFALQVVKALREVGGFAKCEIPGDELGLGRISLLKHLRRDWTS